MKIKPNILFITTLSLANNPRLVKEFETLKAEYTCFVVSFQQQDWSRALTDKIIARNQDVHFLQINRKELFISTVFSKLVHKAAIFFNPYFKTSLKVVAYAHNDKSYQLKYFLYKLKNKNFHRVIAHNLGAFYPAYCYAKNNGVKLQLDVEDYHPGELPYFNKKLETYNRLFIMKKMLSKANHVTYAAPLIQEECFKLVDYHPELVANSTVINNCFSAEEFQFKLQKNEKLKLVWFSQNITAGRGLEELLPILNQFSNQVELHLIGNLYADFNSVYLEEYAHFVHIHAPRPQHELNLMLSEFDIGLALEVHTKDYNRQICLTNKIWSYMQSGLYIFATITKAQEEFMKTHPDIGRLMGDNHVEIRNNLQNLIDSIDEIRLAKQYRFRYAQQFSWEIEQYKLKKILLE